MRTLKAVWCQLFHRAHWYQYINSYWQHCDKCRRDFRQWRSYL